MVEYPVHQRQAAEACRTFTPGMSLNRLLAYLIACAAFASCFLIYLTYIHGLGFPDGYISELGYAERRLAYIFIGTSVVFGSYFTYLGLVASRKSIGRHLSLAISLYVIAIISFSLIDYYYGSNLMGSTGG